MLRNASQPNLFDACLDRVVNVASVRQLSPFRYPGGKTWLIPRIRHWLKNTPRELIEPFTGGGIVSLTVAAERLADHVTMVELDDQVSAVWKTIFTDNQAEWLADRITSFDLTLESLRKELSIVPSSTREKAFQTILKNRTYHGGILAPGSAPIKYGENGKGIRSRWYAETLKQRIQAIAQLRDRISVVEGDGLEAIRQNVHRSDVAFFIDPPYTAAGKKAGRQLYTHSEIDHEELFHLASLVAGDVLMTYDDAEGVRKLARQYGLIADCTRMRPTIHRRGAE